MTVKTLPYEPWKLLRYCTFVPPSLSRSSPVIWYIFKDTGGYRHHDGRCVSQQVLHMKFIVSYSTGKDGRYYFQAGATLVAGKSVVYIQRYNL